MENQLILKTKEIGIEQETAISLQKTFMPFFQQAEEWKEKAMSINITDENQVQEMQLARESRIALKNIRVEVEKKRKELKEESLRKGKAIDGMANVIKFLVKPIEEHLQKQEDFIKIRKEKKKQERLNKRIALLAPYNVDTEYVDIVNMDDNKFDIFLNNEKTRYDAAKKAERKAEEERIAREKAEAEERERIRIENEKLRKEAEEREKQLEKERKEREKIEAENQKKIEAEQAKRKKIEDELKAKKEAEERAAKEQEEKTKAELAARKKAEHDAKIAPDKEKLHALSVLISEIETPELKTPEGKEIIVNVVRGLNDVCNYIKQEVINL